MPVTYNKEKGKWCMGSNCIYNNKKDAESAEKAYYAKMNKSVKITNTDLAKSFDEEKRIFTSIVLKANKYDNDGVNEDYWSSDVIQQAAHDFMLFCQKGNIGHMVNTDLIKVVESYIAPIDFKLGDGEVNKDDWVMSVKILDDDLWKLCKEGVFKGFSIGCSALVSKVDDIEV